MKYARTPSFDNLWKAASESNKLKSILRFNNQNEFFSKNIAEMLLWILLINDKKYKFMSNTNLQIIAASDTVNTGYKRKITIDYVKLSL